MRITLLPFIENHKQMPSLTLTPVIKETTRTVLAEAKNIKNSDKDAFLMIEKEASVSLSVLQSLLRYSQDLKSDTPKYLYILLKGSVPYHYIPPPKPRVRSFYIIQHVANINIL